MLNDEMMLGLTETELTQTLDYALRLTDDVPDAPQFEVDAGRVRGFFDRWLERNLARCVNMSEIRADADTAKRAIARVRRDPEFVLEMVENLR